MNLYLCIAGLLCFALGFIHSILGEVLIFRNRKRYGKMLSSVVSPKLKKSHLRIIWATWHLTTLFGWCIGFILIKLGIKQTPMNADLMEFITTAVAITMLCSSLLVFIATKGKHLGWLILLIIGTLTLLSN